MRIVALLALAGLFLYGEDTAAPKKPSSHPAATKKTTKSKSTHKSSSSAHAKTTPKSGNTTAKKGAARTSKTASKRTKGSHAKSAQTWRSRQLAPTPDRYKEIQSALAERGYLKKDPSGVWDTESADAMRRFQQDQSLEANGKLNSLSLMALGLGPKHTNMPAAVPKPPAPIAAPPAATPPAAIPEPAPAPPAETTAPGVQN